MFENYAPNKVVSSAIRLLFSRQIDPE